MLKLSTLNVVYINLNFAPCVQGIFCMGASNLGVGTPFRILTFGHLSGSSHAR